MFGPKKNVRKIVKETLAHIHFTFLKTRCFFVFCFSQTCILQTRSCPRTLEGVRVLAKSFSSHLLGSEGPDSRHSRCQVTTSFSPCQERSWEKRPSENQDSPMSRLAMFSFLLVLWGEPFLR